MEDPQKLPEDLGVNTREIAKKCSSYMTTMINLVADGCQTPNTTAIDFVKEKFTYNELIFVCISYMSDKGHAMLRDPATQQYMEELARKKFFGEK